MHLQNIIEALEAERDEVRERLDWVEAQLTEFRKRHNGQAASSTQRSGDTAPRPTPARRRPAATTGAPAARATGRRARRESIKPAIVTYLVENPGSTAGDIAKALSANRNTIATRLSQMVKQGEIAKADKGYQAK